MSALPIIITTAGLNALVNAQNTGASSVVIASLGVSPTQIVATAATAAIPGEVKRIPGVAGQVVADDQIYISAADQTEDTYTVRTIGLYLDTGVLFAVFSQATPLIEKAGPAMAVLEAAIKLSSPQANALNFTGGGWLNPQASETVQGVLRLATEAEAKAGTNTTRAVTPKGLKGAIDVVAAWVQTQIDAINQALAGKAAVGHTHVIGQIDGLVAALNAKAAAAHTHVIDDIAGLIDALAGKATAAHTHAMSQIDGLTQALAGKAATVHTHVMGEISGLTEALAGKAAAAHAHVMADVTGLVAALALKAPLNTPIFEGGTGPEGGEVRLKRPTSDTDFDADVAFDVYKNKLRFFEVGGRLRGLTFDITSLGNGIASVGWHSGNFDPSSKANALHSHDWAQVTGKPAWVDPSADNTVTGYKQFIGVGTGTIANGVASGNRAALEARAVSSDGAAYMAFHRPGAFASLFGVDFDNQLKWGGWSLGAVAYRVWHEGNLATAAQYRSNADVRPVSPATVWSAAAIVNLVQAATIAVDLSVGLNFSTTMTDARTLGAPANAKPGQSGVIQIVQDGTGGRTLAFDNAWKFANGVVPVLSTGAGKRDVLVFTVIAPGDVVASLMKDVRR